MATDEPPYLTIGTDVSAKYKGAFCEAKIKKAHRIVKCKVNFKNNLGTFMVTDDQIKGPLRVGAEVEAKHPEKGQFLEAVINKLQDYSQYTVVFDDGDETTLRRTSLCLKSGRHFAESPTLDQFPLTNPEHFSSPVIGTSKFKRKRRSTMNSSLGDFESSDDESVPRKVKAIRDKEHNPDLGRVVCVDFGDRRKKENWYPGLIMPVTQQSNNKVSKEEHLVRSFKDGKYYQVPKRDTREFNRESIQKVDNNALRTAVEKAINYLEKDELPPHWEKALFAGLDVHSADEDSRESDSDTSDDEPSEEKDRFVAQLYKFMDERGTPINKAPTVTNRDLNLYKLFKIMHKLGGYNKVTNKNKWKAVYLKMGLPASNPNGPNQIKFAYKRFLQSFEDFYRKLGCTMVSNSRSTRGRHRSDRNFIVTRTRDRESPKGRKNSKEPKEKAVPEKKGEEKPKGSEKKEVKSEEAEEKLPPKSPEKKRTTEKPREEEKPRSSKKEVDKPRLVRSQSLTKGDKRDAPKTKEGVAEKARTREDARKEKNESPEKKGTRSASKAEVPPPQPVKKEAKPSPKEKEARREDKSEVSARAPPPKKEPPPRKPAAKEKKPEEKQPKEKQREVPPREKKEEKRAETAPPPPPPKEERTKPVKKEEPRRGGTASEERSPKRKLERLSKERKGREEPLPEQPEEEPKEEQQQQAAVAVAAETEVKKELPRPKLRERKEEGPPSEEEGGPPGAEAGEDAEGEASMMQDDSEKKVPPGRHRGEDGEEPPPNKGKRRSLKMDEKDEKESLCGMSDSDDSSFTTDCDTKLDVGREVEIGDRVKVKYGRGRLQKVYEAKVLKVEPDGAEKRYYVHYAGWNTRYDEWVRKSYIVANVSGKQKDNTKSSSPTSLKKVDRGRPPGILANTRPDRKNSTGSLRATRSERKGLQATTPPPCRGPEQPRRRRPRKKSATATDASQESETASEEEDSLAAAPPPFHKEELFSDDEEKEKMEEAKRGDITELERAICVEESQDGPPQVKVEPLPAAASPMHDPPCSEENKISPQVLLTQPKEEEVSNNNTVPESEVRMEALPMQDGDVPPPEVKEAVPDLSLSTSPSVSACSVHLGRFALEESENRSALSFAGLINKTTLERPDQKTDNRCSPMADRGGEPSGFECKSASPFKSSTIFDDVDDDPNSTQNSEKFDSKSISTLFDSILKKQPETDSCGDLSKSSNPCKAASEDSEKLANSCSENAFSLGDDNSKNAADSKAESNPPAPKLEDSCEDSSKPKDNFDALLMQQGGQSSGFCPEPPKRSDSKDDIFSFTFSPHNASKDNGALDPPQSDPLLCRKSVDVSKMIPGILERLKKDVVADVSDSPPPPPKEELNFDFLRGSSSSQGVVISKCLSRSDSSNSLRICASDTNDSNLESKDSMADLSMDAVPQQKAILERFQVPPTVDIQDPPLNAQEEDDSVAAVDPSTQEKEEVHPVVNELKEVTPEAQTKCPPEESGLVLPEVECAMVVAELRPAVIESSSPPSLDDLSAAAAALSSELPSVQPSDPELENIKEESRPEEKPAVVEQSGSNVVTFASDAVDKVEENVEEEEECAVKEEEEECAAKDEEEPDEEQEDVVDLDSTLTAEEEEDKTAENEIGGAAVLPGPSSFVVVPSGSVESSQLPNKKDPKKKKLGKKLGRKFVGDLLEKDDAAKGKLKTKKRLKQQQLEDWDKTGKGIGSSDLKSSKSKKLKKSKNKKRFLRHEEGERKCSEFREDDNPDKLKKREKKRSDKKFLKGSSTSKCEDTSDLTKKKKNKKNRDKLSDKSSKDFFEKKVKKKRKPHPEDTQDTDSDKEESCRADINNKKRKRKKFKVKECSSSDEGGKTELLKSVDPDMSFLLCEEKVDDSTGSSSGDETQQRIRIDDLLRPGAYCSGGSSQHKHSIDNVLDNTPPTTPSSTESLLSSSPSHERDPYPLCGYPESTTESGDHRLFGGRVMPARGSEEYRAATTLAFAVCKSVSDQGLPSGNSVAQSGGGNKETVPPFGGKRARGADSATCKRKKKRVQRYPESTTSKTSKPKSCNYPRVAKVENYCEDSSGTSPATSSSPPYGSLSSPSFSRSLPNRLTEGATSRYSVPLHEKDPEKRISVLQDKMAALRKRYMALRAEVIAIDHKRRKARKKVREAAGGNPSFQSEDGPSCS